MPSSPTEYGDVASLRSTIVNYIHRYVALSPDFAALAAQYVLLSWVFDAFNEVPYLRVCGDYGTGKSRFLSVVGSLCYRAFLASGASTVAPIFYATDTFGGTLVIDEADFRFSDERADITKILNNGNARGMPVLRMVAASSGEFTPRAFRVFGPKIVAARGPFADHALESRFITETLSARSLRPDIPVSLPPEQHTQAQQLRNQLLLFRFRTLEGLSIDDALTDMTLEPRIRQVYAPLANVEPTDQISALVRRRAQYSQEEILENRTLEPEAQLLELIRDEWAERAAPLALRTLAETFRSRFAADHDQWVTPRWIGHLLRRKLYLRPRKSNGRYVLPPEELAKVQRLCPRYGLTEPTAYARHTAEHTEPTRHGDDRDVGDVAERAGGTTPATQ